MKGKVYTYHDCEIIRVIDGDTYDAIVDLGFSVYKKTRIRLKGVDTPEIRGKDKELGISVKAKVQYMLEHNRFTIHCYGKGKYGRWICDIELTKGKMLSSYLLKRGWAKKLNIK